MREPRGQAAKAGANNFSFNEALKNADVIDVATWRFVQHLGDIRNTCGHNKAAEPTSEQVGDLISGVTKMTKTLF